MLHSQRMQVETALFFETPEEIYARVFRQILPRTAPPEIRLSFYAFANANSLIRLSSGVLEVKVTDILREAPAPILEALAYILLCKLYRKAVPVEYDRRYRMYLNRRDIRAAVHKVRQIRGRKNIKSPSGDFYDLTELFEELNLRFFFGLMARPELGWSSRPSRTTLGHYDPSHNTIVLSSILDSHRVPRLAVEYVMFHEMLHLRHPVEHRTLRRCVHTPEFKKAEQEFPDLEKAKLMLRNL